jgi:hypothetical protein
VVVLVGQADAGDAGESEEVALIIRVGTRTDKALDEGGDAPLIHGGGFVVLYEGYGSEEGIMEGRVYETDERVCLFVGDRESYACTGEENEWIRQEDEWQSGLLGLRHGLQDHSQQEKSLS